MASQQPVPPHRVGRDGHPTAPWAIRCDVCGRLARQATRELLAAWLSGHRHGDPSAVQDARQRWATTASTGRSENTPFERFAIAREYADLLQWEAFALDQGDDESADRWRVASAAWGLLSLGEFEDVLAVS